MRKDQPRGWGVHASCRGAATFWQQHAFSSRGRERRQNSARTAHPASAWRTEMPTTTSSRFSGSRSQGCELGPLSLHGGAFGDGTVSRNREHCATYICGDARVITSALVSASRKAQIVVAGSVGGKDMQGIAGRIMLGFVAAAISVVVVHEGIILLLSHYGLIRSTAWGMQPIPPWGVPRLVNNIFWGGLWGILFALIYDWIPGGASWLKGLIFGLCIVVVSNWIMLPLIKGRVFEQSNQVLFNGWNPQLMLAVACIVGGFGLGLGIIYGILHAALRRDVAPASG
jgi:hypothetical protein